MGFDLVTRLSAWARPCAGSALLSIAMTTVPGPSAPAQEGTTKLQASWWNRTSGRDGQTTSKFYRIRSDLTAQETRLYGERLDVMYQEYKRRIGVLPQRSAEVNDVFMFRSQEEYLSTLREQFGLNGAGSGGMFFTSPRGAGLAFFVEGLPKSRVFHVIQHEGFHQYAYSRFGNDLPPWVNEGIAEFFGESVIVDGTVVIGQTSVRSLKALQDAIEAGKYIRFRDMITMNTERWNANVRDGNAALQYMQAWSMVHFLVYGEGGRFQSMFEKYLALLNRGSTPYDAFVGAFQSADIEGFEKRWLAHTRTARPSAFVTALERIEFLAEGLRTLAEKAGGTATLPKNIEELQTALKEVKFTTTVGGLGSAHGKPSMLSASDDLNFQIPDDDLAKGTPTFAMTVTKSKRATSPKDRERDEKFPLPPSLSTKDLAPRNLVVRWIRSKEGDRFTFDIDVK
ncbi:MAG: DUF1570 domain-containing protein [Phycisphaerae bacterium]|nr:DUF1570 domain-containing protein [Phycisphaerae bacterium]